MKEFLIKNIRLYYGAQVLSSLRFMAPVWILFFSHYLSFKQIGILEAIGVIASLVLEVPTGAFADLVGRKTSLVIGYVTAGIGFVYIGFADSFQGFLIGYLINSLGTAFVSGAETALLYDSLKTHQLEDRFAQYSGRGVSLGRVAVIVAMVCGQYLYSLFIGLPYIAVGITTFLAGVVYVLASEPESGRKKRFVVRDYFQQIYDGAVEAFKDKITRRLSAYFITIASVELLLLWFYYAAYLSWLGYTNATIGWVYAGVAFTRMIVSWFSYRIEQSLGEKVLVLGLPLLLGITLGLSFIQNIYIGTVLLVIHYSLSALRYTILDHSINKRFESRNRASAISTLNMIVSLIYAIVVLGAGEIITLDNIGSILTFFGLVMLIVGLPLGFQYIASFSIKRIESVNNR